MLAEIKSIDSLPWYKIVFIKFRFVQLHNDDGIVPPKRFEFNFNMVNLVNNPIVSGIAPLILFFDKSNERNV